MDQMCERRVERMLHDACILSHTQRRPDCLMQTCAGEFTSVAQILAIPSWHYWSFFPPTVSFDLIRREGRKKERHLVQIVFFPRPGKNEQQLSYAYLKIRLLSCCVCVCDRRERQNYTLDRKQREWTGGKVSREWRSSGRGNSGEQATEWRESENIAASDAGWLESNVLSLALSSCLSRVYSRHPSCE